MYASWILLWYVHGTIGMSRLSAKLWSSHQWIVKNHGIPDEAIQAAYLAAQEFFALPDDMKMEVSANYHVSGNSSSS